MITIALAYGPSRVPATAIDYLEHVWEQRTAAGSAGSRYFALTTRRAFLLLALRRAAHPKLAKITSQAESELRERILGDGLFVDWQIDASRKAATGDVFSTAMSVLAYSLSTAGGATLPPEIEKAAQALLTRLQGNHSLNVGVRKFCLAAVTTALDVGHVTRKLKRLSAATFPNKDSRDQDSLYFWDYTFDDMDGLSSRRDYFHVPSDALDILVASGVGSSKRHKAAALQLAGQNVSEILKGGFYYAGRVLATSNNQAWTALAISRARSLVPTNSTQNLKTRALNFIWSKLP